MIGTPLTYLPKILREGLIKGEVPITHRVEDCENAVWLTTMSSPEGHGLSEARPLTETERTLFGAPPGSRFPNKRAVRITVKLLHKEVRHWPAYGKKRLDPKWYAMLERGGGGRKHAKSWYLHFGSIGPEQFTDVEIRRADGRWESVCAGSDCNAALAQHCF